MKIGGVGIYLSQSNINALRHQVENKGGFQIALAPMQPATFIEVKEATNTLYRQLLAAGFSVLVDDRGRRPKNMFEVIEFLGIQHRLVISGRSLSAGVCEYKDLHTNEFYKIHLDECFGFLKDRVSRAL